MSCEQVYNVWMTEPDLICIFDFRSNEDFYKSHIPGARLSSVSQIEAQLTGLNGRLAVIIADLKTEEILKKLLEGFSDVVFMSSCEHWQNLNYPIAGDSINKLNNNPLIKGTNMENILVHQLFETQTSTYTYIIADTKTKEAAIIDPVLETVDRDLNLIEELGLRLMYVLDTHIHADHITGAGEIRKKTKAKTGVSHQAPVNCVDMGLEDGQELSLGDKKIKVISTPGHTNTCLSFYFEGMVFTGDALLIRGTGRTDFQQGSASELYNSIKNKLFKLPDETKVYPGHDYKGMTVSTIGLEKSFNPRIGGDRSKEDFVKIMSELKLANPKKIHEAVPANLACGVIETKRVMNPQLADGVPIVSVQEVFDKLGKVKIIDVRGPDEFNNELGHIKSAELVTLGPDLTKYLESGDREQEIIFVCRSGGRSGSATQQSINMGYRFTVNMSGGMIAWNAKSLPKETK